jgi:hypothetical protein
MSMDRDRLHRIIDELPEGELHTVEKYLEYVRDTSEPVREALANAPLDDEPETEVEREQVKEALADLRAVLPRGEAYKRT